MKFKALLSGLFVGLFLLYGGNAGSAQPVKIDTLSSLINSESNSASHAIAESASQTFYPRTGGRGKLTEKIDNVQQSIDTLVSSIDKKTEVIKNNTHFGAREWIGWWVAFFSLIFAAITYLAQSKTEKHTQNAPISAQVGQFKDLTRHLYRNVVCTSAAIARYNSKENKLPNHLDTDTKREAYPSESNFNKLKTMPDDVILDIDVDENTYAVLHELRVLLRNYNIEIDVASKHISNASIWNKALIQDFDNLLFKPLHLVKAALGPESLLLSTDSGIRPLSDRGLLIVIEEHFDKLRSNFNTLGKKKSQAYLKAFFGSVSTNQEKAGIDSSVQKAFNKIIDETGSVKRSVDNLAKLGCEEYGSDFTKKSENGYSITLDKDDLKKYLESLDKQVSDEIEESIEKRKRKLLWAKMVAILSPFKREKFRERVQILDASIIRMKKQLDNKPKEKLWKFVEGLTSIIGAQDEFKAFSSLGVVNYTLGADNVSYEELFKSIRPYLEYISQKGWVFNDLLYVMLAIDASIEVNRIGMVNYE